MKCKILIAIVLFFFATLTIADSKTLDGFSPEATADQLEFEKLLIDNISPVQIEKHLKWLMVWT